MNNYIYRENMILFQSVIQSNANIIDYIFDTKKEHWCEVTMQVGFIYKQICLFLNDEISILIHYPSDHFSGQMVGMLISSTESGRIDGWPVKKLDIKLQASSI